MLSLIRLVDNFRLLPLLGVAAFGLVTAGILCKKQPVLTALGFGLMAVHTLLNMASSLVFSFINVYSFLHLLRVLFNLLSNGVLCLATLVFCAFGAVLLTDYLPARKEKFYRFRFAPVFIRLAALLLSAVSMVFFMNFRAFFAVILNGLLPLLTAAALILLPPKE